MELDGRSVEERPDETFSDSLSRRVSMGRAPGDRKLGKLLLRVFPEVFNHSRQNLRISLHFIPLQDKSSGISDITSFLVHGLVRKTSTIGALNDSHHWFSSRRETLDGWTRLALVSFRPVVLDFDV
jgi:hypothetical protein